MVADSQIQGQDHLVVLVVVATQDIHHQQMVSMQPQTQVVEVAVLQEMDLLVVLVDLVSL